MKKLLLIVFLILNLFNKYFHLKLLKFNQGNFPNFKSPNKIKKNSKFQQFTKKLSLLEINGIPWEDMYYEKKFNNRGNYLDKSVNERAKGIKKINTESLFANTSINLYNDKKIVPEDYYILENLN